MKTESRAWQQLQEHASAQLSAGFADGILRVTHGSPAESRAWRRMLAHGAAQLRPGFAARVLEAARAATVPSFYSQLMLSAATAAVCLLGVFMVHSHSNKAESARNLVSWEQIAAESEDLGQLP